MMRRKGLDIYHGALRPCPGIQWKDQLGQPQWPKRWRLAATLPEQLVCDACREQVCFRRWFFNIAETWCMPHREPQMSQTFPRFLGVKGLVSCPLNLFTRRRFVAWMNVQYTGLFEFCMLMINRGLETSFCCLELKLQDAWGVEHASQAQGYQWGQTRDAVSWPVPGSKSCWETDSERWYQ